MRVISNISTGETGLYIAEEVKRYGADVTLVLGPAQGYNFDSSIKVIHFKFFKELEGILKEKLSSKKFDILIHCAAVSDYKLKRVYQKKLRSELKRLNLVLEPTEKIADSIKKYDSKIFLVVFKLELDIDKDRLIKKTRKLLNRTNADLAVGNTFNERFYRAIILDREKVLAPARSKRELAKKLLRIIESKFI